MAIQDVPRRLVQEHSAMRERWGQAPRWCCNPSRTQYWWEYEIGLEGSTLPIRIAYPPDYPASPPEIIINAALPAGTPHLINLVRTSLPGARMCWYFPGENRRDRNIWNPASDTAALAIGAAHRWFLAFLMWLSTGQWPVPDAVG
jgi:hypothetical protein